MDVTTFCLSSLPSLACQFALGLIFFMDTRWKQSFPRIASGPNNAQLKKNGNFSVWVSFTREETFPKNYSSPLPDCFISCIFVRIGLYIQFSIFLCLFIFQRERESKEGSEREGDTESKQAPGSELLEQGLTLGSNSQTVRS